MRDDLFQQGYTEIFTIFNNSGWGTDIIAFKGRDGCDGILVIEVKTGSGRLSKAQKAAGPKKHTFTHMSGGTSEAKVQGRYRIIRFTPQNRSQGSELRNAALAHFARCIQNATGELTQEEIDRLISMRDTSGADALGQIPGIGGRTCRISYSKANVYGPRNIKYSPWEP
ncbi:hypothetical protein [Mangrovicoccus ximenensis]|uniref:hypothetical protein n=1 Tax=Mangrovicoccus ximenensis TaxID=1911570 RepID=UPI000D3BDE63|nr:hypothetical protein [Mangrovicoccus ximenensis]